MLADVCSRGDCRVMSWSRKSKAERLGGGPGFTCSSADSKNLRDATPKRDMEDSSLPELCGGSETPFEANVTESENSRISRLLATPPPRM